MINENLGLTLTKEAKGERWMHNSRLLKGCSKEPSYFIRLEEAQRQAGRGFYSIFAGEKTLSCPWPTAKGKIQGLIQAIILPLTRSLSNTIGSATKMMDGATNFWGLAQIWYWIFTRPPFRNKMTLSYKKGVESVVWATRDWLVHRCRNQGQGDNSSYCQSP